MERRHRAWRKHHVTKTSEHWTSSYWCIETCELQNGVVQSIWIRKWVLNEREAILVLRVCKSSREIRHQLNAMKIVDILHLQGIQKQSKSGSGEL